MRLLRGALHSSTAKKKSLKVIIRELLHNYFLNENVPEGVLQK